MLKFFQKIMGKGNDVTPVLQKGAIVLDVRTKAEYAGGHVKGSVNIPLDVVGKEVEKIRKYGKPVVTCCRSGMRSESAAHILRNAGIEAYNGGSWQQVENALRAAGKE